MTDSFTQPNFHSRRTEVKFSDTRPNAWLEPLIHPGISCLFELADHGKQEMCRGRRSGSIGAPSSMTNHFSIKSL